MVEVATPARAATSPIGSSDSCIRPLDLNSGSSVKVDSMTTDLAAPNHHHDHPAFAGLTGLVAAATMTVGRDGDARLAVELARLAPGDLVVDVGCGPGVAARHA